MLRGKIILLMLMIGMILNTGKSGIYLGLGDLQNVVQTVRFVLDSRKSSLKKISKIYMLHNMANIRKVLIIAGAYGELLQGTNSNFIMHLTFNQTS